MQIWTDIRRKVLVEKVPKRQICRDYQISFHTLEKMLQNVEPTGYQQRPGERPRPKLGAFVGVIDQILEDDKTAPKKQRHTAKRIFVRIPGVFGHPFRLIPDTHSGVFGHLERGETPAFV